MEKFKLFTIGQNPNDQNNPEGAVPKLWVQTSEGEALFKIADINTYYPEVRSDWPEKIISELAKAISLPAARYDFAQLESSEGLIPGSISFRLSNYGGNRFPLEEILEREIENYNYGTNYSVSSVIDILESQNIQLPPAYLLPKGIKDGADMYVGALLLDAYTLNFDRHGRNFDIIITPEATTKYLSPIFDNGKSLGFLLNDEIKAERSIPDYSQSVKSSITVDGYQKNGLEVFAEAAKFRPQAAKIWQKALSKIDPQQIQGLFDRIPEEIITPTSKDFAIDLLNHNQKQLLNLEINLSPSQTQQMRVEIIAPILIDYLKLNNRKRVESNRSIVEFDSVSKTITYQNKTDKEERLSAQYADSQWIDKGSNISQSQESFFTNDAAAEIKRLKAKKLEANQSKQSNKKPKRRR